MSATLSHQIHHQAQRHPQHLELVDGERSIAVRATDSQRRLAEDVADAAVRDGELSVALGAAHDQRATAPDDEQEVPSFALRVDWSPPRNLDHRALAHDLVHSIGVQCVKQTAASDDVALAHLLIGCGSRGA